MSKTNSKEQGKLRCAIYTRKSSEEGLDQDFNSLDAQREACEAFIASQKQEGWRCLADLYDDGGYSGGTIERPALRELLADVEQGLIDVVVVYKVDRLTRSLTDFAKIVDVLDTHDASFVSVTQAFNTTTSMGRLTLNVLLSFAQFEREVTGERIRDKIAASKKKGMWMGGVTPLGYRSENRKLIVDQGEATTVRHIFRTYLELGSVRLLKDALNTQNIVSKVRVNKHGKRSGGKPFARGALYHLLQNRIYAGKIVHKDKSYPGNHEAVVDEALWRKVQDQLALGRHEERVGTNDTSPSLLAGMIHDDQGCPMTPTHAIKKAKRYRYYVSRPLQQGATVQGMRIPAGDLEHIVTHRLRHFFSDRLALHQAIEPSVPDAATQQVLFDQADRLISDTRSVQDLRHLLLSLDTKVRLTSETVEISINIHRVATVLEQYPKPIQKQQGEPERRLTFTVRAALRRAGLGIKLHIEGEAVIPDIKLIQLLVKADLYFRALMQDKHLSMTKLAEREGVVPSYITRILRLHFLSPTIKRAIIHGRQPPELTARQITLDSRFPLSWEDQRRQLGFTPPA